MPVGVTFQDGRKREIQRNKAAMVESIILWHQKGDIFSWENPLGHRRVWPPPPPRGWCWTLSIISRTGDSPPRLKSRASPPFPLQSWSMPLSEIISFSKCVFRTYTVQLVAVVDSNRSPASGPVGVWRCCVAWTLLHTHSLPAMSLLFNNAWMLSHLHMQLGTFFCQ